MNEPPAPPPPDEPASQPDPDFVPADAHPMAPPAGKSLPPPPPPRPARRYFLVPWVFALAFVALAGAVAFLWLHPLGQGLQPGATPQEIAAMQQQIQSLGGQVKALEQRPVGPPLGAFAALQAQVAGLENRKPSNPNLSSIEDRLGALEKQVTASQQQIAALSQKPPATPSTGSDLGPIDERLARLNQRVDGLQQQIQQMPKEPDLGHLTSEVAALQQQQSLNAGLKDQLGKLGDQVQQVAKNQQAQSDKLQDVSKGLQSAEGRLNSLQTTVKQTSADVAKAVQASQFQAAAAALAAGRPIGSLAGAPPALARFATEAPPTEADLRLAFPQAAQAALAASEPSGPNRPFFDRVWTRAQDLISVRQGDRVLVGDPAAGVIARARASLDAGDLAGAVNTLSALNGPAAEAMQGWLDQARALLAARAALAPSAAHD